MIHDQISWASLPRNPSRIILGNASRSFCIENNITLSPTEEERSFFQHAWETTSGYLVGIPGVGMENMTVTQAAGPHPAVIALISISAQTDGKPGWEGHLIILRMKMDPTTTTGTIVLPASIHPRSRYSAVQLVEYIRQPEMLIAEGIRDRVLEISRRMKMKLLWEGAPNNQLMTYIRLTPHHDEKTDPQASPRGTTASVS